jgi:hypothetical protein
MKHQEIIHRDPQAQDVEVAPKQSVVVTPMDLLNRAVAEGAKAEAIERLAPIYERWAALESRKAFSRAIAKAKAEIPSIVKNKLVDFTGNTGKRTTYRHETLDQVLDAVEPVLSKHGLSVRYSTKSEPGFITVVCLLEHDDGHVEENSLTAPLDTSGNKNAIQSIGSAQTYLQRYTLKAALGLAAAEDDDGMASGNGGTISSEQAHRILDLANEVGADIPKFCAFFKIESIPDLPVGRFNDALRMLEMKKAKR